MPPTLTTKSGEPVNAVYGFALILLKVFKDLKPDYIAATFDMGKPTFRHKEFKEYKAQREKPDDSLIAQIPRVKEVVRSFNIPIYEKEGFEADDVIGTITCKLDGKNIETVVVTGDQDTMQLVNDHTKIYMPKKGMSETILYDDKAVVERYGLKPSQLIDYKALRGDPSDNIPGVKGIGEKTASELLQKFTTLEALYDAIENNSPKTKDMKPAVLEKLKTLKADAFLSKKLATIQCDVPLPFVLKDAEAHAYDKQSVVKLFHELEFKSLLAKLPPSNLPAGRQAAGSNGGVQATLLNVPKSKDKANYETIATEEQFAEFLKKLSAQKHIAFDTETSSLDALTADLLGMSFSWQTGEAYFVHLNHKNGASWLQKLHGTLRSKGSMVAHNAKFDLKVLMIAHARVFPSFDTMIASYILRPGTRQHSLDALAFAEFGYEMQPISDLIGKGREELPMKDVPLNKLSWYSAEDADFTLRLEERLRKELAANALTGLFEKIEMPLVPVLADMEITGIAVDVTFLKTMAKRVRKDLVRLEEKIHTVAGTTFNISSPLQLKTVLFEKLKLSSKGIGKTKTGISTAAGELEKMANAHPIIKDILLYRELSKLLSTYLDALPKLVHTKTKRVHTEFNQTIAATGRLSSSNPNLQNIPVRTELGAQIRKAFVAEKGNVLVSADYSQIELRIVAAMSGDKKMLDAFRKGEDIHSRTAAEINGVPIENVTKQMRYAAKEVNFGVIYGMGAWGLAARTGISREEASLFIDKYFALYKDVAAFLDMTKEVARKRGFVETLFGRRRYLPDLQAGNQQIRAAAERMAVNMPIQGTAADLIKLAMIAVHKGLPTISPKSRMVLQVHDELVVEVPEADVPRVASFLKETLETLEKLPVPIVAEVSAGKNWGEMEEVESK